MTIIETYRDWTIQQGGDGIICLDPKGGHVLPGGCSHKNVEDARKSIDYFILANGSVQTFWLLWGRGGWDHLAEQRVTHNADGSSRLVLAKRDNPEYRPTYEYEHVVNVTTAGVAIRSMAQLPISAESALALSNVLRDAALVAMKGQPHVGGAL